MDSLHPRSVNCVPLVPYQWSHPMRLRMMLLIPVAGAVLQGCGSDLLMPVDGPDFLDGKVNNAYVVFENIPLYSINSTHPAVAGAAVNGGSALGGVVACLSVGSSVIVGLQKTGNHDTGQFSFTEHTVTVNCHDQGTGGIVADILPR